MASVRKRSPSFFYYLQQRLAGIFPASLCWYYLYKSRSTSTGQWSLPIISVCILASVIFSLMLSDTRK